MFKNKSYHYPWRQNNRFQVLIDGSNFFSAMLNEIKKAKKQILFEAYLFESGITADQFISALCAAKKRNVEVFILLDEYGTKALLQTDKNKITESGIKLLLYNPVNFLHLGQSLKRNHRKLMVVDNMVAFIGGAGITDDFNPSVRPDYWHDIMLKTEGDIVSDLSDSFYEVWNKQQPLFETTTTKISQPHHAKIKQARIIIAQGTENNEINRTIINHIRASKNRIWLTSPYFISSWKIRRALRYAANKGVDVRLIFPGPHSDHKWITHGIRRYYHRLLHSNVSIYEYQPRFSHSKIFLCDNWFTLGSSNLDRWNQFLNLDANIEVFDANSCEQIIKLFLSDFSLSKKITLTQWKTRSYLQRIKEWISGFAVRQLEKVIRKFKR